MSALAKAIFAVAVLGVLALSIYGAVTYARTLQAIRTSEENAHLIWQVMFNWLFASQKLKGEAAVHAANVNKAVCGVIVCVIVAALAAVFAAIPSEPVR